MSVLKIQPGPGDSYDTFVNEDDPTVNYKDEVFLLVGGPIPDRQEALIQFDLSGIPEGAVITKAVLGVYTTLQEDAPDVLCCEISQSWYLDTVDWISRPIRGMPGIPGVLSQSAWTLFDVLDIVNDWITTPAYNLGFQIVGALCEESYNTLASGDCVDDPTLRPYLEITYTGGVGPGAGGVVVQVVQTNFSNNVSSKTAIPMDTSKPQITEGVEFMTCIITPKSVTNKLYIDVVCEVVRVANDIVIIGALFQDAIADALKASLQYNYPEAGHVLPYHIRHDMVAGTVSSITFHFRMGTHSGGEIRMNGANQWGATLGGLITSSIKITEVIA